MKVEIGAGDRRPINMNEPEVLLVSPWLARHAVVFGCKWRAVESLDSEARHADSTPSNSTTRLLFSSLHTTFMFFSPIIVTSLISWSERFVSVYAATK